MANMDIAAAPNTRTPVVANSFLMMPFSLTNDLVGMTKLYMFSRINANTNSTVIKNQVDHCYRLQSSDFTPSEEK